MKRNINRRNMDVFICGVCREEFHDIIKFMSHKKSFTETYTCDVCSMFFHLEHELSEHSKIHTSVSEDAQNSSTAVAHITVGENANLTIIPADGNSEGTVLGNIQIVYTDGVNSSEITELVTNSEQTEMSEDGTPMLLSVQEVDEIQTTTEPEQSNAENSTEASEQTVIEEPLRIQADSLFMCKVCSSFTLTQEDLIRHLQLVHCKNVESESSEVIGLLPKLAPMQSGEVVDSSDIQLVEVEKNWNGLHLEVAPDSQQPGTLQLFVKPAVPAAPANGIPKRKRGRPRKSEQLQKLNELAEQEVNKQNEEAKNKEEIVDIPQIGIDGKYHCAKCKRSFTKERHIRGHKCWGANAELGDYVDLTKKDLKDEGDESELKIQEIDEDEIDTDLTEDFKAYIPSAGKGGRGRGRRRHILNRTVNTLGEFSTTENDTTLENKENLENETMESPDSNADPSQSMNDQRETSCSIFVPVFNNEDQKRSFEEKLNSVDLSEVDHLFTKHVVEQNVNELAPKLIGREKEELEVYSCNICKKVFKTLSHMRLHCLIHTDLKPFKCPECSYASNAKGNLYTHMRKHTGNYFTCSVCDFKSCNRSHMAEHEATHSSIRHKCRICANDYNTLKSLMNHVRKYHRTTKEGKEYLMTFMLKANKGAAILHQCHICNRKFKKKLDRDRHLFVHNIRDNPYILHCDLCDYTASRRSYLENHFRKHRVVYVCCKCKERFLSTMKLKNHLKSHITESNMDDDADISNFPVENPIDKQLEHLFLESINVSWYLPEPDGAFGAYMYANIPEELVSKPQEGAGTETEADKEIMESVSNLTRIEGVPPEVDKGNKELKLQSDEQEDSGDESNDTSKTNVDIVEALNYKQMNFEIFTKIRESFGNEECRYCGRLFHSHCDFELHFRTHAEDKPHKCARCDYSAVTRDNLKRHTETVHEKKRFVCEDCGYTALSRTSMWHHQQKHKNLPKECPECKKTFTNLKKLRAHIICAHPNMNRNEAKKLTGYNHRIQGRLGRRSYKCPYCARVFHRSNTDLMKHIWIHEGIKPFKCPLCPHSCRSRNNLNVHMLRHSSEKPHLCEECGKAYKSKTALRWHVRSHTDGQIFACDRCEYTGTQKSHLKRHMETHEIVKRYVCELCKYSSNTLGYMKVHYARKHKGAIFSQCATVPTAKAETKVYKCISCEYLFGNLSDLKRHLKMRHHVIIDNLKELEQAENTSSPMENTLASSHLLEDTFQVVQVQTEQGTSIAHIADIALQELQFAETAEGEMDENTASAVNIIQQIIEQGAFGAQTVAGSEDHSLVAINPDSIVVQEEGQEVVVGASSNEGSYVIQYLAHPSDEAVVETVEQSIENESS